MQEEKDIEEYAEIDDFETKSGGAWKTKFEGFLSGKYFVPIAIVLVAIIAFSLGRISGLQEKRPPVRILNSISNNNGEVKGVSTEEGASEKTDSASTSVTSGTSPSTSSGQVVASKSGTKYHYPWCAGAKQISEKNKITFDSIEAARAAGYTPASNCKGLK
jgi:hypothetical protein